MGASLCSGQNSSDMLELMHTMHYPMWVMPVEKFLQMEGPPLCHQALQSQGTLVKWQQGMFTLFFSHQWLGMKHADPAGSQLDVMREAIRSMINGELPVCEDWMSQILLNKSDSMTADGRSKLAGGFLWLDWQSIPQPNSSYAAWQPVNNSITASQPDDDELAMQTAAHAAVMSIPAYAEAADVLVICAPTLTDEKGQVCDYRTFCLRGWCRTEVACKILARRQGKIIVVRSAKLANYIFPMNWLFATPGTGDFSVESDRKYVRSIMEASVDDRIAYHGGQGAHGLFEYRFFKSVRGHLVSHPIKNATTHMATEDEVTAFRAKYNFGAHNEQATNGWRSLMCAAVEGDISMVRAFVQANADPNQGVAKSVPELFMQKGATALMNSALYNGCPEMITTLLELRADIHAEDDGRMTAHVLASVSDHEVALAVLLERGANIEHKIKTGGTALIGAAMYGATASLKVLLRYRADVDAKDDFGWTALHCSAVVGVPEIASCLIDSKAAVNVRARPQGFPKVLCMVGRVSTWFGSQEQLMRILADTSGITPLGMAALFGQTQLCDVLLAANADLNVLNDTRHSACDVARLNGQGIPLIEKLGIISQL